MSTLVYTIQCIPLFIKQWISRVLQEFWWCDPLLYLFLRTALPSHIPAWSSLLSSSIKNQSSSVTSVLLPFLWFSVYLWHHYVICPSFFFKDCCEFQALAAISIWSCDCWPLATLLTRGGVREIFLLALLVMTMMMMIILVSLPSPWSSRSTINSGQAMTPLFRYACLCLMWPSSRYFGPNLERNQYHLMFLF